MSKRASRLALFICAVVAGFVQRAGCLSMSWSPLSWKASGRRAVTFRNFT